MKPLEVIEAHAPELKALGVQRLGVFGSFARGEERPDSDVDVYLEFAPGMKTYDNFYAVGELLEALLGRPIDLVTDGALRERKRRLILPTVRYAALDS
jgi:predicted nucleotidyltransferase